MLDYVISIAPMTTCMGFLSLFFATVLGVAASMSYFCRVLASKLSYWIAIPAMLISVCVALDIIYNLTRLK